MTAAASTLRPALMTARVLLDDALVGLRFIDVPGLPLAAIEASLTAALTQIYRAMDSLDDLTRYRDAVREALDAVRESLALLQFREVNDDMRNRVAGVVAQSIGELNYALRFPWGAPLRIPRSHGASRPRASRSVPRRIELPRAVLAPVVVIPKPTEPPALPEDTFDPDKAPPPSDTLEALEALTEAALGALDAPPAPAKPAAPPPPPTFADDRAIESTVFGEAVTADEALLAHARGFFEDLAMMGLMRQPDPGDLWHEMEPIERRLLAKLDGILAVGTWVLPALVKLAEEEPVPDPEMLWGAAFVHGCLVGVDAMDEVVRLVRTSPLDDADVLAAFGDALAVIPHESTEDTLRAWITAPDAPLRWLAAHALGRRRAVPASALLPLLNDPEPSVAREAARALVQLDSDLPAAALAWLVEHPDPDFARAGFAAALAHRDPIGVQRARALMTSGHAAHGDAAIYFALASIAPELDAFDAAMRAEPSETLSAALGWAGHLGAVPYLLDRFEAGDGEALGALQRITGASLTEDDPEPVYPDGSLPFTRPDTFPPEELVLLEDSAAWRAWWAKYGARADTRLRYRHGHPWTTRDNHWELAERAATADERTFAWLELVARTGRAIPFDAREWVTVQRRQVAAWGEYLTITRTAAPGRWFRGGES